MSMLRLLAAVALTSVAAASAPEVATAQSPCGATWFARVQREATADGEQLLLFRRGYAEGDTLAAGIRMATNAADSVTLIVGEVGSGAWLTLVELRIPTLLPSLQPSPAEACFLRPTWMLDAAVVDLDADGQREIVVEYNRIGTCAKCFSEVTVLAWRDGRYRVVLESAYAEAVFAPGEGLTLQVPQSSPEGKLRLAQKRFFERRP